MGVPPGVTRCAWADGDELMRTYHDAEWGVPQHDESVLFEFLTLEGAQAGLSWRTVLNKRERYREVFAGFDVDAVSALTDSDVARLLGDPGIIRNRAKIEATIGNARAVRALPVPFDEFVWAFVDGAPVQNRWKGLGDLPATTPASDRMSKELKRRGFRFVGGTICYSFMQACGLVNDHVVTCFRAAELR
jgi:DNA-3-methyladenine glycosylase I